MMIPDTLSAQPPVKAADRAGSMRPAALILAEMAALALAFAAIRPVAPDASVRALAAAAIIILAARAMIGLVPGRGLHPQEIMRRSLAATLTAIAICLVLPAMQGQPAPGRDPALFLILALPLQYLARIVAIGLLHAAGMWTIPVHVIANSHQRQQIEAFFRHHWSYGLDPDSTRPASVALVTDARITRAGPSSGAYDSVILLADMPHLAIAGLRPSDVGGAIGLWLTRPRPARAHVWFKRALDLAVAVPLAVLASPLIAVAATAIWIADPGPVFYSQPREGQHRRTLRVLKLRTMYRDADRLLQDLLDRDPAAKSEWNAHFKLKRDPRILPGIGHLLRRSSCDELPQLLNVIGGGMSLVGPRPFPDYHLAAMRPEFRRKRCTVPPGITGLWQISDRSDADVARQEQLDEFYIDNRSVWLDLSILLRTIPAVLLGRGAC